MDEPKPPADRPQGMSKRLRRRLLTTRQRGEAVRGDLELRFGDRFYVKLARDVIARDRSIAGSELAGALAYRLFLWFLPFVLVVVAGLGVYSDASDQTPEEVADRLGMAGLVVHSVSAAAMSNARWYAIIIGLPVLLYLTRSLLRSIVAVHRLAWAIPPRKGVLTVNNVLLFLAAVVASLVVAVLLSAFVAASGWSWFVVLPGAVLFRAAVWLWISRRLPAAAHDAATLLPGALVIGVGFLLVNVGTRLAIEWLGSAREDTYGVLGLAATLLFSLWLTSRVIVTSAIVNAALWERQRTRRAG